MYTKSNVAPSALARQRILVVDDDEDTRELTGLILRAHGAEVTEAGSAADGLSLLQAQGFDALVADIGLRGSDGYELIRAVRALPPTGGGQVAAIAVTGYASAKDRNQALAAGYDWHLSKPVDPASLVDVVSGVLLGRRMRARD